MADGPLENVVQELRRIAGLTEAAGLADGRLLEVFTATSEPAALEVLVRRHGPMVLGVCRRVLRHTQDAEDAFQATFLVLVRKAAGLRRGEAVGNWLYGVAYRTALQTRTRSARRRLKEAEVPPMDAEESTVETAARLEMKALLDRELNRLPDKYRAPIILCDLLGKTKKQAAVELRCPEGTVSSRLARGRELLKKRLEHHAPTFAEAAVPLTVLGQTMTQALPAGLCVTTVKAAVLVANGTTMASLSPSVAAIVQGVMKSMLLTKLKPAVLLFVGFGLLSGMTFVVASGMGVGNGPGDVADKGKAEKPTPAVVVAEREMPAVAEVQSPPKVVEPPTKEELRYDGKNFNDWLKVLQTELKPERQVEAIDALMAFAPNGYEEVAGLAILESMKKDSASLSRAYVTKGENALQHAQRAVVRIGPKIIPVLAKELASENVSYRRLTMQTLYAAWELDANLREPLLWKGVKDEDSQVRDTALVGIAAMKKSLTPMTAKEKQGFISILRSVIERQDKDFRPSLNYPPARESAMIVLDWFGPEAIAALPFLITVVENESNSELQARAADTIGRMGPSAKEAVPPLLRVLSNLLMPAGISESKVPAYLLETYVVRALGQIGPEAKSAVPALVEILTHTGNDKYPNSKMLDGSQPPSRRVEAAKALAKLGKEGISALIETASMGIKMKGSKIGGGGGKGGDPSAAAIDALAPLGSDAKDAVPVFVKLLERDYFWASEFSTIQALGRIGPDAKEAVPVLLKRLELMKAAKGNASFPYLQAVIVTLGEIGPGAKEAVPQLVEIRDSKESALVTPAELRQLKDAAAKALEKIQK